MPVMEIIDKTQETIVKAALTHFEIDETTLVKSGTYHVSYMRWCIFYLVKNNTLLSLSSIGKRLGKKHFCVRNGIRNLEHRMRHEKIIKKDIANISKIAGLLEE